MNHENPLQARLAELAEPLAASLGLEILLIEDVVERGQRILRFYLEASADQEIGLGDCEKFSRLFSPVLEAEAGIGENYYLEVSSPGLNRPLVKPSHFEKQIGKVLKLVLKEAVANRKKMTGRLQKVFLKEVLTNEKKYFILMESEGQNYEIPFQSIKKANLDYFASEER